MLVVNRWTNPNTQEAYICAHVLKANKLFKSYSRCDESMLSLVVKGYRSYMLIDVSKACQLDRVNIVNNAVSN